MNYEQRQELLRELCRIQAEGAAPVKLGIGYASHHGSVIDDIVIYECPPVFITELKKKGYFLSMSDGGLRVGVRE